MSGNNRPDYRVMIPYIDQADKTRYREVGAVWKFKTDKCEGFTGHFNRDVSRGQPLILFKNDPKPAAKTKAPAKKRPAAKKKAAAKKQ